MFEHVKKNQYIYTKAGGTWVVLEMTQRFVQSIIVLECQKALSYYSSAYGVHPRGSNGS